MKKNFILFYLSLLLQKLAIIFISGLIFLVYEWFSREEDIKEIVIFQQGIHVLVLSFFMSVTLIPLINKSIFKTNQANLLILVASITIEYLGLIILPSILPNPKALLNIFMLSTSICLNYIVYSQIRNKN